MQFPVHSPDFSNYPTSCGYATHGLLPQSRDKAYIKPANSLQEPGEAEKDFASVDTPTLMKKIFSIASPRPLCIPKEEGFRGLRTPETLPSWLSEEDINYYATKFTQTGFTGGLNYYRACNLTWELTAPWTGSKVNVPVKYIVGDLDLVFHLPGIKEYIHDGAFKQDVPNLQDIVVMEGVNHFIFQEKPEEVNSHISDFIKKF